jgi:hypothetical protein
MLAPPAQRCAAGVLGTDVGPSETSARSQPTSTSTLLETRSRVRLVTADRGAPDPGGLDSISAGFAAGQGDKASGVFDEAIRLLRSRVSFRRSDTYYHAASAQLRSQASGASYVV